MTVKEKILEVIGELPDDCSIGELYDRLDFLAATRPEGAGSGERRPLRVPEWLMTLIILAIPVLNIIMYLVWAFGRSGNISRKNFCKASLLLIAIVVVVGVLVGISRVMLGLHTGT